MSRGLAVKVNAIGPEARRRLGLLSAPEDRLGHAAVPEFSLTENTLLLGDAALTEVSDREESGIQQMAPWQNGYYCITEEGLTHRRL